MTAELPPTPSSRTVASSQARCSCLQQQVQLVYQLSNLDCDSLRIDDSVERVFIAVQFAQVPWKALMQCKSCQAQDNQKEVFLLFAMSIRILLNFTQKVATYATDGRNTASASSGTSAFDFLYSDTVSALPMRVGCFEVTGSTKDGVIRLALRQALHVIQFALLHLRERNPSPRPHQPVRTQAAGHRVGDLGAYNAAPNCDDIEILAHSKPDVSLRSYTMEDLWGRPQTAPRQYDKNIRPPRTEAFQAAKSSNTTGEDDIGSMFRTLQSSMSAVV
jgi:hypothetical protein